jgi:hypothetical protein
MESMSDVRTEYLTSLAASLRGPRRVRRSLVQEASDHLEDATLAHVEAGLDEHTAACRAVADFGTVDEVAPHFQTTLAVASARRTALMLLTVMLVQPFVWDDDPAAGRPDGALYAVLDTGVEALGMAMMAFAFVLALACGIGNRWFLAGRSVARLTAVGSLVSGAALVAIGVLMTVLGNGQRLLDWVLVAAFILVPIAGTSLSARRTLAAC